MNTKKRLNESKGTSIQISWPLLDALSLFPFHNMRDTVNFCIFMFCVLYAQLKEFALKSHAQEFTLKIYRIKLSLTHSYDKEKRPIIRKKVFSLLATNFNQSVKKLISPLSCFCFSPLRSGIMVHSCLLFWEKNLPISID